MLWIVFDLDTPISLLLVICLLVLLFAVSVVGCLLGYSSCLVVWIPLFLDPSDGAFGRFDLAALCGCRTLNFCLFVCLTPSTSRYSTNSSFTQISRSTCQMHVAWEARSHALSILMTPCFQRFHKMQGASSPTTRIYHHVQAVRTITCDIPVASTHDFLQHSHQHSQQTLTAYFHQHAAFTTAPARRWSPP